jgi:three-Cys-motif partner protein
MLNTNQQEFGGIWTEDKLNRLKKYLDAYMVIFQKHPYLYPVYVDAFAGTGKRQDEKGSATIALETLHPFKEYIFVEKDSLKCQELEALKEEYPDLKHAIRIENEDATTFLVQWCKEMDWTKKRAVVFLDPFGMQVEWSLLETLANTHAIDLWLLVPLGMGASRLMTRDGLPPEEWADKLTRFFGNEDWKGFYRSKPQQSLFNEGEEEVEKNIGHDGLRDYFVERLKTIFAGVAENPLTQRNTKNSPMFLLCFATANPKPSVRNASLNIAQHILKEN